MSLGTQRRKGWERFTPFRKPVSLCRTLVINHSDHGGLVVDPFAGGGSIGVAALLEGRAVRLNDIDTKKELGLHRAVERYSEFASHGPLKEFVLSKERRGSRDGLTEDEHHDVIVKRAKHQTGMLPERRKPAAKKQEKSVKAYAKKKQDISSSKPEPQTPATTEDESSISATSAKVKRYKFTAEDRESVARIILSHNYQERIESPEFLHQVRMSVKVSTLKETDIYWLADRIRTTVKRKTGGETVLDIPKSNKGDRLMSLLGEFSQNGKKKPLKG